MMARRRPETIPALLRSLETLKHSYTPDATAAKTVALQRLATARLPTARSLRVYHDVLCFLQAWPDNADILAQVEQELAGFERRVTGPLRGKLADSGIVGTTIEYPFSYPTAAWLRRQWPADARLNWAAFESEEQLLAYLPWLVTYPENDALDDPGLDTHDWLMTGQRTRTDFAALIDLFARSRLAPPIRDAVYELLALPVAWRLRAASVSRTLAKQPVTTIHFQAQPLDRAKPDLRPLIRQPLPQVQRLSRTAGRQAITLGFSLLAVRLRELYPLLYANADDAWTITLARGLQVTMVGVQPTHRLPVETAYYFHVLKNGVPIGYGCITGLADRAEVAANIFPEFRWGESAFLYGQLLRIARHQLGCRRFLIEKYQIGEDNDEAIQAGAFWFYYKLGFRPSDPTVARLADAEARLLARDRAYRSPARVLRQLACSTMLLDLRPARRQAPDLHPAQIGLAVSRHVAAHFANDRRAAVRAALRQLRAWLPIGPQRRYRPNEWQALERWSLILVQVPGLRKWPAAAKRDLLGVVCAKGAPSELDYLHRLQQHPRLIRGLAEVTARAAADIHCASR